MGRAYSTHGAKNAYRVFMRRPAGKRHACRLAYNIKMDLREIRWGGMDWVYLAQDRDLWRTLVNMVMNLRVP
jgi:hypothetical protein